MANQTIKDALAKKAVAVAAVPAPVSPEADQKAGLQAIVDKKDETFPEVRVQVDQLALVSMIYLDAINEMRAKIDALGQAVMTIAPVVKQCADKIGIDVTGQKQGIAKQPETPEIEDETKQIEAPVAPVAPIQK